MRLAYLLDRFPTTSETFVFNEIAELISQGDDVFIYSLKRPRDQITHPRAKELVERTTYLDPDQTRRWDKLVKHVSLFLENPVRYVRALHWVRGFDDTLQWQFRRTVTFARAIKDQRVDHLHAHFAYDAAECAMVVGRLTGIPFSITTHGFDVNFLPHRYYRQMATEASFIRTIAQVNVNKLVKHGVSPEKIVVLHCGVQSEIFSPVRDDTPVDILCVARLHPIKGLGYLIEAARLLLPQWPQLRMVIVGDGEQRAELAAQILAAGLSGHVDLVGAKPQNEVLALLNSSKVFCLSSLSEGISVAAMEAMACGLPIVATRVGGMAELVEHGIEGFLVDPESAQDLATHLHQLLSEPETRQQMGLAARKKIGKKFDQTTQVQQLRKLFSQSARMGVTGES